MSVALLEAGTATLIVDRLAVLRTMPSYTLYEVFAHNVDGSPIGSRLRTFDDLPTDTPIQVTLENYVPKGGGDPSLTVKYAQATRSRRPKGTSASNADLEARVDKLERQVRAIIGNADLEI